MPYLSFLLPVLAIGCLLLGFAIGLIVERTRWNALIREGRFRARAARSARPKGLAFTHGRCMRG